MARITRWLRPPAARSSWYFPTSAVTRPGHLVGERRPIGRRGEAHLAVEGERRHRLVGPRRTGDQRPDVAHQPRGDGEQPPGGQPVGRAPGIRRHGGQGGGRDHVGRGGRPQHPLGHVALAPLLDQLDEAVPLQLAQVVVDLLPGQPDPVGQHRRRRGLAQLGQQAGPRRVERDRGDSRILDHRDVHHAITIPPTTSIVKTKEVVGETQISPAVRASGGPCRDRAAHRAAGAPAGTAPTSPTAAPGRGGTAPLRSRPPA